MADEPQATARVGVAHILQHAMNIIPLGNGRLEVVDEDDKDVFVLVSVPGDIGVASNLGFVVGHGGRWDEDLGRRQLRTMALDEVSSENRVQRLARRNTEECYPTGLDGNRSRVLWCDCLTECCDLAQSFGGEQYLNLPRRIRGPLSDSRNLCHQPPLRCQLILLDDMPW